jgi:hypothetical protein
MRYRTFLPCLICVLVTACGGGGGSDSPAAAAPPPTPPQPPARVFALTEANAVQAAAYALAPLEQLLSAGTLALNAAAFMRVFNTPQFSTSCGTMPITITYTDSDGSGTVSVGDVINVPSVDCGGLRRAVALTLTQFPANLQTAAARAEVDIQLDDMTVAGAFDISVSVVPQNSEVTWRITNALVTVTKSGTTQTARLSSGQFTFTPTAYSFSLSGGSVESEHLGGNYTFATSAPFVGTARRLPSSGVLELGTSGGSRARVSPPATPSSVEEAVEYSVAGTASGAFGPIRQTVWTAIVSGGLFGWRPNEAPTLTQLTIQPANPSPGSQLWASYIAADVNDDPLETTFEWRRNGTLVGTNQFLSIPTARNDQVSVTVTVSDGRLSTTATASITIANPPPQLTLTLTPAEPDTTHDLVAVPAIFEPDGDLVTTTYEWRRNGVVIEGRTGATLPATETTRGQTILVRVTASDGASTVEATASTTIVDSPPRVSVPSLPAVAYGTPVSFTVTLDDPDGDPFEPADFVLTHGPAGMTLDAATGVVDWTPTGPMFDREMDFHFGLSVTDAAPVTTGTITVTDTTRDYPLARFGVQIPVWPAGLSVADFDDDGDVEMLVLAQRALFELESDGAGGYRQSWAYPYALNTETEYFSWRSAMVSGDVDGDGRHEIFVASGETLTKLDGVTRRAVATRELRSNEACADLSLADLSNDGSPDLVCLVTPDYGVAAGRILVLRPGDLSSRFDGFPETDFGASIAVGNVDTDAALEIVTASGYVFDGVSFVNEWLYSPGFGRDVDTGDLDGDGVEEIVAAEDWNVFTAFSATLRTPLWEVQRFDLDSLLVADVTGDSRAEVIVGDGQWGEITVYRYNTATHAVEVVDSIDSQDHGVTSIAYGDLDHDDELELIWGTGATSSGEDVLVVAGLEPDLEVEWLTDETTQLYGPFLGGELAGSPLAPRAPLFLSPSTGSSFGYGTALVRMTADGGIERSATIDMNFARVGAVTVVDYDNDGTDEAFVASNTSYDGIFRAYDFFAGAAEWSSPVLPLSTSTRDVTQADLTGDGRADLIGMSTAGVVYAYDAWMQTLIWQSTTHTGGRRVFAADLDGDPNHEKEIVAVTHRRVYVYRRNASPGVPYIQIANYESDRDIIDADVGDTDGDGELEVVLLAAHSYSADPAHVIRLDATLQQVGRFTLPWPAQTLAIEPSAAPRKNLIIGRNSERWGDTVITLVGARSGGVIFESAPLLGPAQPDSVHYVTLPGETRPRISFGTANAMYLTR